MTYKLFTHLVGRLRRVAPDPLVDHYSSLRLLRDRNLVVLAVANMLDQMSISLIVPLLPVYAEQLGANPLLIGLIFAAETAAKSVFSIPFGYVSDRLNRKWLITAGLGISGLSVIALGFVRAPLLFIVIRAIDGIATAMRNPATNAYIGDQFEEAERGSAMGAYRTLGMLGIAIGPALGGLLAAVEGFALPFIVLGVGTVLGSSLLLVLLEPAETTDDEADEEDSQPFWKVSPSRIADMTTVPMAAVGVSMFLSQLGTGAFSSMFAVLMEQNLAVGPAYIGSLWSLFGISMFILTPIGGSFADKAGRKRSLIIGDLLWAVVVLGLVLAVSKYLPPVLMLIAGVATAFAGPALGAIQYEVAPEGYEGTLLGFYSTASSAGMAVGPVLGGAVANRWGVTVVFLLMGGLWVLDTGTITFGVRETREETS